MLDKKMRVSTDRQVNRTNQNRTTEPLDGEQPAVHALEELARNKSSDQLDVHSHIARKRMDRGIKLPTQSIVKMSFDFQQRSRISAENLSVSVRFNPYGSERDNLIL